VAGDRWVWAVTFAGSFQTPHCDIGRGPSCLVSATSSLIVLDYMDGSFLISSSPAPVTLAVPGSGGLEAMAVVSKFEFARAMGSWDDAWMVLAPLSQGVIGSEGAFIADETGYNAMGGVAFSVDEVAEWPFDSGSITPAVLAEVAAISDVHSAFFITVRHPDFDGASAGTRSYIAAPLSAGGWRIWIVH